jgi:beta-galactosidase
MKRPANRLDPSRPIVAAMDNSWGHALTSVIDIQGFNYRDPQMAGFHEKFPAKPIVGTESGSTVCTRGIYVNDKKKGYVSAYGVNFPYWASTVSATAIPAAMNRIKPISGGHSMASAWPLSSPLRQRGK